MTHTLNFLIVGLIVTSIAIALLARHLYQKTQENQKKQLQLNAKDQEIVLAYESFALSTKALTSARLKAIEAVHVKADFLANMSHEIRTPMAGVLGMAELLQKSKLVPQQQELTNNIITSATNLLKILNEILDQSKLDAGKLELDHKDFHLPSFITDTVDLFLPQVSSKFLELKVELAPNLPCSVNADSLRINQILSNLLSNAVKFTNSGAIHVTVEHTPMNNGDISLQFSVTEAVSACQLMNRTSYFHPLLRQIAPLAEGMAVQV